MINKETKTEVAKRSIYSLQPDELKGWLKENGEQPFRSDQILQWLYKHFFRKEFFQYEFQSI